MHNDIAAKPGLGVDTQPHRPPVREGTAAQVQVGKFPPKHASFLKGGEYPYAFDGPHTTPVDHANTADTKRSVDIWCMPAKSEIGIRLKHAIKVRNYNKLYALATEMCVNESSLSRWQTDGNISTENLARLCEILDISADWLLLGRGQMEQHKIFSVSVLEQTLLIYLRKLPAAAVENLATFLRQVLIDRDGAENQR